MQAVEYMTADKTIARKARDESDTIVTTPNGAIHDYSFDDDATYQYVIKSGAVIGTIAEKLYTVSAGNNGEIVFKEPWGKKVGGSRKYPVYMYGGVNAYYLQKSDGSIEQRGINWENVKSVSGRTYDVKEDLKKMGFAWDKDAKKWVRNVTAPPTPTKATSVNTKLPRVGAKVHDDYIAFVKQQVKVDLSKARDTTFDNRNGFNIDTRRLDRNDLFKVKDLARKSYGDFNVEIVDNGANRLYIKVARKKN